jgi:diaminobutyrate-2-oxoglutarate transaminase
MMETFERLESEVRSYCRSFPTVFETAKGHVLTDEEGNDYIDFFAGAGTLNYGHNEPELKKALVESLESDAVTHGLDMATTAKREFLETFEEIVLRPRGLDYKVMFPGPTGTNAVEAALKLARKVTGRTSVIAFTNAFHGMTLGSLALTGNSGKREGAGIPLDHVTRMPFDGYLGRDVDTIDVLKRHLDDPSSGVEKPAAIVVETVQGEGGVNTAGVGWLRRLERVCRKRGILLVIDDIQVGCGRTGPFFSFERAGIRPDMVTLSKSLSGYGLPFAITLMKPELDEWDPGEHNGTFRGNNPAFVTATAALRRYWATDDFSHEVVEKGEIIRAALQEMADRHGGEVRGRGMIRGLELSPESAAGEISKKAFENGLVIETSGSHDQVLKLLPPLTIPEDALRRGLAILSDAVDEVLSPDAEPAAEEVTK